MSYCTFAPRYRRWASAGTHTIGNYFPLPLVLLVTCLLGIAWPSSAAEVAKDFQKLAKEEIENGTAVASKPHLRVSAGALYVNLGAIAYDHAGSTDSLTFQPMQNQLRLELLRQYAFTGDADRSAASPFFDEIERYIQQQRDTVRAATLPIEAIRAELRAIERSISEQIELAIQAVALARGLDRALVERPAHPGWKVTVVAPPRTIVRYTPYLNYALNPSLDHKLDWSTAQNGDTLRLRGRTDSSYCEASGSSTTACR